MAPRARWWHQLQASKSEVTLAVDLYNRSGHERQLEAFIVHMSIGWLKLLQAKVERDHGDLYVRDRRGRRIRTQDGEWTHKPLRTLAEEFFGLHDARFVNLMFFIGLRNRIEHRYERDIATLIAGRTQALLLNYETTLVELFGVENSLGTQLRFPLFLSSITESAADALKNVRKRIPRGILEWIQDFDLTLESSMIADQKFDFKIYLIPYTGPKTQADAAMTYIRLEELSDDELATMSQAQTIIRDRKIPVSDLGALLPTQVAARVADAIGRPFTASTHHARAWRYFGIRPPEGATDPTKTRTEFCRWNPAFMRYVYTESWVNFLIRKLSDEETYRAVMALPRDE
jgi:hypothetical protein